MILALIGASATGKTAVAKELSTQLGWNMRCCGEQVKSVARELGVQLDAVPPAMHANIDDATRLAAEHTSPIIIEGRYLNYVLANRPAALVSLVRLEASPQVRLDRFRQRGNLAAEPDDVVGADAHDARFVSAMYADIKPLDVSLSIVTDPLSVSQVARRVRDVLGI